MSILSYIMGKKLQATLSIPARRALLKLGQDIQTARRRRRIPTQLMAERAGISRSTLAKIEKGASSVALGHYAMVLFILGMIERLAGLADITQDEVGLSLDEEHLPKRIRLPKSNDD